MQYETLADRRAVLELGARSGLTMAAGVALGHPPLAAYANHGRWVVDCPWCRNGILAHPDRTVWCCVCGFAAVGGQQLPVVWPADREAIDEVLDCRPVWSTRNCFTDSTLDDLLLDSLNDRVPVPGRLRARAEQLLFADWARRGLTDEMRLFNAGGD